MATGRKTNASGQHADMDDGLELQRHARAEEMGVDVAEQQHGLEEDESRVPHRRRAAQERQRHLGEHRLDLEQQPRAQEDGGAEQQQRTCDTAPGEPTNDGDTTFSPGRFLPSGDGVGAPRKHSLKVRAQSGRKDRRPR
jgi:hypothetical protein